MACGLRPARAAASPDSLAWARARLAEGRYAAAEPVARRALGALETRGRVPRDSLGDALDVLVESLWRRGFATRPETRTLAERALALRDTGAADDAVVPALANLGAIRTQTGDLAGARPLLERAVAIRGLRPGRDSLDLAWALNERAALDLRAADLASARAGYERVLAMRRRALGGSDPLVAWSFSNLASALEAAADFVGARTCRERCLAIRRRALPPDHPDVARGYRDLASDLHALGDEDRAVALERRALAVWERGRGAEAPEVALALTSLAGSLRTDGDLSGARGAARRALAIRERAYDASNPEVATSLLELGRVDAAAGELAMAEDTIRRALAIRTRVFGPDDPVTALALDELAAVLAARGHPDSAEALCARSIRAKEAGLGAGHPNAARTWRIRAEARARAGDPAAAATAALECERIAREHLDATLPRLEEADALAYEATRASGLGLAARLAARSGAPQAERRRAWDALVRSRSRVLDAMLQRGERARAPARLDDVLAGLPAGAALVSYVRCEAEPAPLARPACYVAFAARAGGDVEARMLGGAAALDTLVARWRGALLARGPGAEARARADGERLRRAVWDPVRSPDAASRVFVVFDGALLGVTPYAWPARAGGWLVERGAVVEPLTAERELSRRSPRAAGSGLLLAIGGVRHAVRPGAIAPAPLPESAREVDSLAALWRALPAVSAVRRAEILRGEGATCAALRARAPAAQVLHVATHGVFADDARAIAREPQPGRVSLRAVLARSGLLLAAAPGESGDAAGFLSASDAASLDLRGAHWVVLSGCETAAGRVLAREGAVGLERAFKLAGARVVIASLWPVEDRAAREWMTALYRARWSDGLSTGAAARAACREVLARRRRLGLSDAPATWAGFVTSGIDD